MRRASGIPVATTRSKRMLGHAEFRARRHFGSLDGLRCISILAVIWHHTGPTWWGRLAERGNYGVGLFFAISGFLITTLLLRERDSNGSISLKRFYMRRTLRIFPLYYTVLLVYVALVLLVEPAGTPRRGFFEHLPAFLTYTSNWFVDLAPRDRVIFYFAWSLATEEQFYLAWPALQRRLQTRGSVLCMLSLVALAAVLPSLAGQPWFPGGGLPVRIIASVSPAICFGVVLAHLLHGKVSYAWTARVIGHRHASLVILILCLVILSLPTPEALISLSFALLVGACAIREDHVLARALRARVMVHLGMISYGMYLMHMLSYNLAKQLLGWSGIHPKAGRSTPLALLSFASTTLVVVVAASLSHKYYESIFLRIKERFASRVPPPRAAA